MVDLVVVRKHHELAALEPVVRAPLRAGSSRTAVVPAMKLRSRHRSVCHVAVAESPLSTDGVGRVVRSTVEVGSLRQRK